MLRPAPRSTLFPYTTLFRSLPLYDDAAGGGQVVRFAGPEQDVHDVRFLDRKSTRLNSSHRCISYAVFCLKKKNDYRADVLADQLRPVDAVFLVEGFLCNTPR